MAKTLALISTLHQRRDAVLVPAECRDELAKLSKAALMDMVWGYAMSRASASGTEPSREAILAEFWARWEIIRRHREDWSPRLHGPHALATRSGLAPPGP